MYCMCTDIQFITLAISIAICTQVSYVRMHACTLYTTVYDIIICLVSDSMQGASYSPLHLTLSVTLYLRSYIDRDSPIMPA